MPGTILSAGPDPLLADELIDLASTDECACVHVRVERAARAYPHAVALEFEGATLTYAELDARATRLARRLRALRVGVESRVGVCAGRSLELVVALLAVLKAGSAYVPLDPAYPRERLAGMIEDGGVRLVLAQPQAADRLPSTVHVEPLDLAEADAAHESAAHFESGASPESLAYVLFTSGSTGRPKGVMVPHRAVARLLEGGDWCRYAPDETFMQFVPIAFDVSTFEIWGPLSCGARLVLFPPYTPSLEEMATFVQAHGITTLWLTSGLFHPVVDAHPEAFAGVRRLLSGGDVVSPAHVRRVLEANPGLTFVNGYGPTEVTTYTTCHVVRSPEEVGATVPIGRPIARTVVHLLDAALRPVAEDEEGELCAGGAGVARGYQGRPALTAERFVPDPFSGTPGARLYRTGDLARRNLDGTLEFLGRLDQQVKIRGFRVEPGEVEAALASHPLVRQAAVVAREDRGGRRLVGYVVAANGTAPDTQSLRAHLRATLPEHMLPAAFVFLDALPVNPNGKVDRRALPAPEGERAGGGRDHASPRTPAEELLAAIWAEVLGVERLGVHDDVFALGAHSLASMRVASRVREMLRVELPLAAFFEHRTVAELARAAEAHTGSAGGFPPVLPRAGDGPVPPSFQQESVWFLQELEPAGRSYHFQATLGFRGPLEVAVLERALGEIVRRHELLRTTFPGVEGSPVQRVHAPWPVHLPVVDFTAFSEAERDGAIATWMEAQLEIPFALASLPLIRWALLKRADDHHVLVQVEHHVVHDGWTLHLLLGELVALYRAFAAGEASPLPELEVQYADYAAWQRRWMESDAARAQLDFWRGRLAGGAPVLELPADRRRPAMPSFRGAAPRFHLPQALYERLRAVGHTRGATLFMTMLAAFEAVLARWSGEEDLRVGTGMACRRQRQVERLIGMFVNMVVVRTDASGDPTFGELLARVRRATLDAYAHQDVPFDSVVGAVRPERALGHNPLFQTAFNFHDSAFPDLSIPGLELELEVALPNGSAKFDLNVIVIPHAEQRLRRGGGDGGMTVVWEYAADLFDPATAERMFAHFRRMLEAVADDPEVRVSTVPLLDAEERSRVVEAWNHTAAPYPPLSVAALFGEVARRTPDAPALVGAGGVRVRYGELEARANRLARVLRRRGVGVETRVGVCVERGVDQVTALLAILKAGGAYVPLDPAYPPERLAYMARDSAVRLVLAQPELADRVPRGAAEVVPLGAALAEAAGEDAGELESGAGPDTLAYVLYTSGSTGQPKGVMAPHRAVVRLVRNSGFLDFSPGQVFLGFAPVAFDASTLELWGPLLNGGALALHPPEPPSLEELGDFIRAQGVTTAWLTAGLFHQMVEMDPAVFGGVRQLLAGGDVVSPHDVRRVLEANPGLVVVNGYGPTEGTTFTCCHAMRAADEVGDPVPLGRPIGNTRVYVLDARGEPVPVGVPGELCAGGDGVARGYQGRPAATAERFVPDPFSGVPGARLYRTGDRVRWRAEAASAEVRECGSALDSREGQRTPALPHSRTAVVEFLGRLDTQVKIRGFRIEPGEVEAALARHPGVRAAVVVPREDRAGDRRLVAYVTADGEAPSAAELRTHLRALLPAHLVPAAFVALDEFPLTANGKVDRRALPAPDAPVPAEASLAPRTGDEAKLAAIWAEVLGLDQVGVHDDFFALGGHSLRVTQIVARVRKEMGADLPLRAVFEAPTVAALAERVAAAPRYREEGGIAEMRRMNRGTRSLEELRESLRLHAAAGSETVEPAPWVAPRTPTEALLAAVWAEVLERDRVGADDDFFALGGHSLLATLMVSRVRQTLGVSLPLRALFESPTLSGFARSVDEARAGIASTADGGGAIGRVARGAQSLDRLRETLEVRATPRDGAGGGTANAAPRTETERALAVIWAEAMERPEVGVHDDFFHLGGHSLVATQILTRIGEVFGVRLPLRALMDAGTVAALAGRIDGALEAGGGRMAAAAAGEGR